MRIASGADGAISIFSSALLCSQHLVPVAVPHHISCLSLSHTTSRAWRCPTPESTCRAETRACPHQRATLAPCGGPLYPSALVRSHVQVAISHPQQTICHPPLKTSSTLRRASQSVLQCAWLGGQEKQSLGHHKCHAQACQPSRERGGRYGGVRVESAGQALRHASDVAHRGRQALHSLRAHMCIV